MQTLEKYYPKEEVESSLRKIVAFEEEKVTLDIPEGGKKLTSGWSIVPMAHPASVSSTTCIYLYLLNLHCLERLGSVVFYLWLLISFRCILLLGACFLPGTHHYLLRGG